MLHFLDACHKELLRPAMERAGNLSMAVQHTTLIRQLFGGYLRSRIECLQCHNFSHSFDPFVDLSVEVNHASTLEKAFEYFMRAEKLGQYHCKRCGCEVEATKQFSIHTPPPILIVQLKRFEYTSNGRGKIMKPVAFRSSLNIARFSSTPESTGLMYRLYAVIVHAGPQATSGHYSAFVRHSSGAWYHFDDR